MRKRIVFVMPTGRDPVTGGERNMLRLVCGIDRERFEAIALCRPGALAKIVQDAGIGTAPLMPVAPIASHLSTYLTLNNSLHAHVNAHRAGAQAPCQPVVDALCALTYEATPPGPMTTFAGTRAEPGFHLVDLPTGSVLPTHIAAGGMTGLMFGRDVMRLRREIVKLQPYACVLDEAWDLLTGAVALEGTGIKAVWYLQTIDPPQNSDTTVVPRISIALGGARACLEGRMQRIAKKSVVYSGIDTDRWRPKASGQPRHPYFVDVPPQTLLIGMAGILGPLKGQDVLIRACGELQRTHGNFKLYLFGDDSAGTRDSLLKLAQASGVSDKVVMTGNRSDLPDLLPHLDISVFLSRQESLSMALCEGMACGLPTICNDLPGFHEVIEQSNAARMVALDPAAVASALRAFMDDPALRVDYGQRARERIKSCFTMRAMFESIEKALTD